MNIGLVASCWFVSPHPMCKKFKEKKKKKREREREREGLLIQRFYLDYCPLNA